MCVHACVNTHVCVGSCAYSGCRAKTSNKRSRKGTYEMEINKKKVKKKIMITEI